MSAVLDLGMGFIIPLLHSAGTEPDVKQTFIRTCIKAIDKALFATSEGISSVPYVLPHLALVKNSEYDQEIPQSETADEPMASQSLFNFRNRNISISFSNRRPFQPSWSIRITAIYIPVILISERTIIRRTKILNSFI